MINLFNADYDKIKEMVIDAYTAIYGKEYEYHIRLSIKNSIVFSYYDSDGMLEYINYLKDCKKRELLLKYLDHIGVNVEYNRSNYSVPFSDEILRVLEKTVNFTFAFNNYLEDYCSLYSFDEEYEDKNSRNISNRLSVINFILEKEGLSIAPEDLDSFIKTEKYQEILKIIGDYRDYYDALSDEFSCWEKEIVDLEKLYYQERKRNIDVLILKREELLRKIYEKLPIPIKKTLEDKDIETQLKIIFGNDLNTGITAFSSETLEALKDKSISLTNKIWTVVFNQMFFLRNFDIDLPFNFKNNIKTEEDLEYYLNFINELRNKGFLPSLDAIDSMQELIKENDEEALDLYLKSRFDFLEVENNHHNFIYKMFCDVVREKLIQVSRVILSDDQNNRYVKPYIHFAYLKGSSGALDFLTLHEFGHAIDCSETRCGFNDHFYINNPYDSRFLYYERFNEVITDCFALEALEYLHGLDIYLFDTKETCQLNCSNINTSHLLKELVQPLIGMCREDVVEAKIFANPTILADSIGADNYEELVDIVNKVDYFVHCGLEEKLKSEPNSQLCIDYFEQKRRAEATYEAIGEYYKDHKGYYWTKIDF